MLQSTPTALIADDEPLLRDSLARLLRRAWPELEIIAQARNGLEAMKMFDTLGPQICFLDVQMPGATGVDAARHIGRRAHIVFVTAYDEYAVEAFAQGVLDYLVKPVEPARLDAAVARVRERLQASQPALNTEALLQQLAEQLQGRAPTKPLRWLRASVGDTVRLIAVDDIAYLRSDEKYTRIAWRDDRGQSAEAVIRTPLKDLATQLDRAQFVQVHRSVIVNLQAIAHVKRGANDTATIHLKERGETLPVSRGYLDLFRQM